MLNSLPAVLRGTSNYAPAKSPEVCSRETLRVRAPLPNPDTNTNATCFPALGTNVEG